MKRPLLALLLLIAPAFAAGAGNPPVWTTTAISGDPLFFVKPPDGPAKALLLHIPAESRPFCTVPRGSCATRRERTSPGRRVRAKLS